MVLLAGLAGAGMRAGTAAAGPDLPAPPAARLELRDVLLRPGPVAVLRLTVTAAPGVRIQGLSIAGGGLRATEQDSRPVEAAGGATAFDIAAAVDCSGPAAQTLVASAVLLIDAGGRAPAGDAFAHEVEVVQVGRLGQLGGACRSAQERLPDGWQDPVEVVHAAVRNGVLLVRVRGLAATDQVPAGTAGAESYPVGEGARAADGTRTLRLHPPPPRTCGQPVAGSLPAGFGLRVVAPGRPPRARYAAAGLAAARWVAQLRRRPCTAESPVAGAP